MILNTDYRRMLRTGYFAERRIPQKENEAGAIVFWCMAGVALIILAVMLQSCGLGGVR